ncbi:MAG TPA: serine/threonine protein phosphatase [Methanocorpusculum sp.]|nr:serine/threonine protein phosphatase [Methanocorpusculum sp.]
MSLSSTDIKNISASGLKILRSIESLMHRYSWVPEDSIRSFTHMSATELTYQLGNLINMDLIRSNNVPYKGYSIVFKGFDVLATHSLANKKIISSLGSLVGVGKESEVYSALGFGEIVLKFHKVGQRSFQTVRINREYLSDELHCPWIFASINSAKREYTALCALNGHINVPVPIGRNRHTVVMSRINGINLNKCQLIHPDEVFKEILNQIKVAYGLGYIHGDLSEYNIMFDESNVWIIDWPQYVSSDHPNALQVLHHDIETIISFFSRKYKYQYNIDEAIEFILN